ncbi:MAG: glycosyltransferase family 39 protein [Thermoleophilia bacterium]
MGSGFRFGGVHPAAGGFDGGVCDRQVGGVSGGAMGRERKVIVLLWLALLAQGVVFALIQPVWSRVDEAQHFDFVQYLSENFSLPVEGKDFVSRRVVDISVESNQWGWRPVGALSAPAYLDPAAWQPLPDGLSDQDQEKWLRRNLWRYGYEAMQPPLYYAVNAPLYAALPDDSFIKLYGMRLLAALMASAMVPLAWLTAREIDADDRLLVYGVPVVVLLTQGYALNMSQITNDALAVPLSAAAVLLLLRIAGRGVNYRRSLAAGALIGAALLSKMTAIFLLPVVLIAMGLLIYYKRETARRVLAHTGIIYGVAAAIMLPWLAHNIAVYGDATGASAARPLMSSFFESPLANFGSLRLDELLPTFWFGEPVFPFPFWTFAWVAVGAALSAAIMGLLYYYLRGEGAMSFPARGAAADQSRVGMDLVRINFAVLAFVVGALVTVLIPFGSGIGGVPGRYLYPLLPLGAFLLLFGIERLLERDRARFMVEALLVWMVIWESLNFLAFIQNRGG